MSISTRKYLSQISLGAASAIVSQLEDATPDPHVNLLTGMAAGFPEPIFMGAHSIKPDIVFSSTQLLTLLTALNTGAAAPFAADQSAGNTDLFYQDAPNKGSRTAFATTNHQRFRLAKALLYWTQITAQQEQEATISCRLKPIWDGTNVPMVAAGTLAITGASIGSERYTLGPVKINGTLIGGLTQMTLDSGIQLDEQGADGEIYDSFASIEKTGPVLTLTGQTVEWWNTYGLMTALSSLSIFLIRKNATGNYPNTDTPSRHIAITAAAGAICPDRTNGIKSATTLKIAIAAPDFATASLVVNTASDIS